MLLSNHHHREFLDQISEPLRAALPGSRITWNTDRTALTRRPPALFLTRDDHTCVRISFSAADGSVARLALSAHTDRHGPPLTTIAVPADTELSAIARQITRRLLPRLDTARQALDCVAKIGFVSPPWLAPSLAARRTR